ncbi:hypothetical protein V3C99_015899 [Haemonchus contortus]
MLLFHFQLFIITFIATGSHAGTETSPSPLEVTVIIEDLRLLELDERPSTIKVVLSLCLYWIEKQLSSKHHIPEVSFEKAIEQRRYFEKFNKLPNNRRRQCYSTVLTVLCPHFVLNDYPKDSHNCDLLLMAKDNASDVILLPHLHTGENHTLGNTEWTMIHMKTIVQWVTIEYEDFEMAVVSFVISRNSFHLELIQRVAFLLNLLLIFLAFPANSFMSMNDPLLAPFCQIALWIVFASISPEINDHPLIVRRISYFVVLSVTASLVGYFAPLMTLGLRCVPYHAHPRPIDFPTPNELLSLDSERTRYSSVMNSARHDSSPSQRNVNTDLCMAQLRYTLSAINEFLSIKASAKWHRRQWLEGFARVQMLLLIFFQTANLILFLVCSSN